MAPTTVSAGSSPRTPATSSWTSSIDSPPEHPSPAAVHDIEDTVKYVFDQPEEYTTSQISVSGFSSGGTLALIVPTLFPPGTSQSAISLYPATDLACVC
ncbi:hypothetical protein CNMCM5793_009100 [Aspergillus hiratsukae]|uniref:Alpha/beta hydrolase fold-3 domain-containing protein n=1 Tax=Aspergillus hiratsukae TaxID=1194566 RepID=A0A8H6PYV0_9EURO|nr:hypothetical protein CNMCM5793_009100 [Aspergillus hiratsukae]KAF7163223.1 hypothetical protein CNMCM6106_000211 [Aspergillus hiratsukae]